MEEYRGKVHNRFKKVKVTIIDESGLLKFQDGVTIVIYHNGEGMLLIDDKKAIESMREDMDRKLNIPLP